MSKKPRLGRPPLDPADVRDQNSMVRMTAAERATFEKECARIAKETGVTMPLGTYFRVAGRFALGKLHGSVRK